jgi:hypothetical protein
MIKKRANKRSIYNITGVSGEYFVAGELSRRGWITTITLKNTPNIDILATMPDGGRTVNIQVKTRSISNRQGWILGSSIETPVSGNNFYIVFVDLKGIDEKPDYFIIPKNKFARWMSERHQKWLITPGRSGRVHKDHGIRAFDKPTFGLFEKYHNNWDI